MRYITAIAVLVAIVSICGCKPPASAPAGNTWTIVGYDSVANSGGPSCTVPVGAIGDLLVVWVKWNGTGATLTGVNAEISGAATLRGTENHHASFDLGGRFATYVATDTVEQVFPVFTGTATFIDIAVWRLRVTGTVTYETPVNGTGTSTATSSGPFTTATQNAIVLVGLGIYAAPTISSILVGGNTPTATHVLDVGRTWEYLHTTQLLNAAATADMDGSHPWIVTALALSAQ